MLYAGQKIATIQNRFGEYIDSSKLSTCFANVDLIRFILSFCLYSVLLFFAASGVQAALTSAIGPADATRYVSLWPVKTPHLVF
jgi:hypothetical protein